MAGRPELFRNLRRLGLMMHEYVQRKPGGSAKLRQLRLLLLQVLETAEQHPRLRRVVSRLHGGRTLLSKIQRAVEKGEYALPKAVYDCAHFGAGLKTACLRWGCRPGEMRAVQELAESVGRQLGSFTQDLKLAENSLNVGCLIDVEAAREKLVVYLGEKALEDMLLAAAEGYLVPKTKRLRFTEVYGLCLGSIRNQKVSHRGGGSYWVRHVHVERAAVQLRARASRDSVRPDHRSFDVQVEMARILFPYLEVVGDFHSHPYRTARSLNRIHGWELSDDDRKYNLEWLEEMREFDQEPRVSIIVAMGRKKRRSGRRVLRSNLPHVRFMEIGRCAIAVAAYRILRNADYESSGVELHLAGETT